MHYVPTHTFVRCQQRRELSYDLLLEASYSLERHYDSHHQHDKSEFVPVPPVTGYEITVNGSMLIKQSYFLVNHHNRESLLGLAMLRVISLCMRLIFLI